MQDNSQVGEANEQFNAELSAFAGGEGGGNSFGPDDPWTKELQKHPVFDRMRDGIKKMGEKACDCMEGSPDDIAGKTYPWDFSADSQPSS
jgi:hypothetical protein